MAIETVAGPEGVLVLVDLGSAVLASETAIEMLPPFFKGKVLLSSAPLVEGAITAVIHSGLGDSLDNVLCVVEEVRNLSYHQKFGRTRSRPIDMHTSYFNAEWLSESQRERDEAGDRLSR
jgi:hypothetical protein